jgi:hypothetical protein
MINLNAQYPAKTNAPDANYIYGSARNITTPGDGTGTPWEQALVNDLMGFMQALVVEAGIVPSGSPETVLASDALDSIFSMLQSTRNPFLNYAIFRDEKADGVPPGTFTAGSWQTRDLANYGAVAPGSTINNISGASIAANQITLPAGRYRVKAYAPATEVNAHQARLYNITDAQTEVLGTSENATASGAADDICTKSNIDGEFEIAGAKILELQHRAASTGVFGTDVSFGIAEVYSVIEIWKLD